MRDATNAGKHELIGREIKIVESTDPSLRGVTGKIVDESKNMLILCVDGKEKKIAKKVVKIGFTDGTRIIDGARIAYRAEDRIKKVRS